MAEFFNNYSMEVIFSCNSSACNVVLRRTYGRVITAITWGVGHFFTKDILTGIVTMISGLAFGSVYLLTNRDVRRTYPILLIMFVL